MRSATSDEVEGLVAAMLGRQASLQADPPPKLSVILDEALLCRTVDGPLVIYEQLAALLPLVDGPSRVIRVLPFSHGEHPFLGGSLTLMTVGRGGNCVEWAPSAATHGTVPVRDSKNPDGPTLAFVTQAWAAFVNAVRLGEFA